MSEFKKSKKKDGSTVYSKSVYLGVDPKTGKKKRTTLTAKTQKELKLKIARKKIEIAENGFVSDDETSQELILFEEIYNLWFSSHKNTVENTTAERIESLFKNHIIPKFGNSYLQDIEPLDYQKALNDWYSYYTNYSVLKSYTSSVFKYAISLGLIKNKPNPMDLTIKPKSKKKAKIIEDELEIFYDLEQLEHFFKILENEASFMDFVIFRVLAFTGLRKGELGALTWSDFNKSDKTLRVNKSLAYANGKYRIKPPKNKPSNRILPLDDKKHTTYF
ncbi:hypothetical protein CKN80_04495 [Carnobacterium divergens]|uniref:tyrosine-type recombinase/integrase n=1 Tax=Carnobacterium divergens TaxID=2748 RepID=UPI00107212B0|nr:site-specific integrase [Carnobacterium divergens]TFJ47004.1 hypothetical protein CKN79_04490 [Carnobacterium divergens]TFJ53968.1 hypothetical protein CKN80_04495 [Carnobacterium divergens]